MKAKASPLQIIDFALLNLEFNFIQPESEEQSDFQEYFKQYPLEIDFSIQGNEIIQVFIKADINRSDNKLPGYSIMAEAACVFEFNKDIEITDDVRNSIGGFSTIYIALNSLRGFISQTTSIAPAGRYILPSIDLNDLIKQKKVEMEEKKPGRKRNQIKTETKSLK